MGSLLATILLSANLLTSAPTLRQANIGIRIENLTTGEVVEDYRSRAVIPPASVMKLLTTGAALETFGADYRFATTLEYTGEIAGGVLTGDLYIHGSGDPSLGDGRQTFLAQWVRAVGQAGIRRIEGRIIADMTLLDGDAINPAWLWEDAANYYAPGIFGINYMGNSLNIVLRSGEPGTQAEVLKTEPAYPDLRFINRIRCTTITYDGAFVHGLPYSQERYLTGCIPSNLGTFGVRSDLPNPGLLLAQHLHARLGAAGIEVANPPAYDADYNPLLPARRVLYTHYSKPLADLVAEANTNSNNLYAEALFRSLGLLYATPSTVHNSCEVLREFWRRRGIDIAGAIIKDGCGLAPQDAVSAATWVQVLTYMQQSKSREAWWQSLPVSGKSGTLRGFLAGTALEGRVHAKSGTIGGTKNFAGYIELPNGERWAFCILVNSANCKARTIQPVIERYLLDVYRTHT